jgi:hypothetical protein
MLGPTVDTDELIAPLYTAETTLTLEGTPLPSWRRRIYTSDKETFRRMGAYVPGKAPSNTVLASKRHLEAVGSKALGAIASGVHKCSIISRISISNDLRRSIPVTKAHGFAVEPGRG